MSKRRVLLVDDNATIRKAVRPLFDSHPRSVVCGEAEHGREAIEGSQPAARPDRLRPGDAGDERSGSCTAAD